MTPAPTRQQTWLSQPHHDGSGRYVSNQAPRLGDRVDVLVRVPLEAGVEAVHVRTVARRRGDLHGGAQGAHDGAPTTGGAPP